MSQIVPAPDDPGAYVVVNGDTEQSYVDPDDPKRLEFEYVRRIAEVLDATVLARPVSERVRVVHVGGGGLTLPRYVQAMRPGTAQIVFEPDEELTAQVRQQIPLANRASIKIRPVDGACGVAQLPGGCADAMIIDAFAGACVPADLATAEFFAESLRVLRSPGVLVMNLTDSAPFAWAKRCIAGLVSNAASVAVIGEVPVWKGRRFGNLTVMAGGTVPAAQISRRLASADFPHRLVDGSTLVDWLGGAPPFTRSDSAPSPEPNWGGTWFGSRRHR